MSRGAQLPVPTEHQECAAFIDWTRRARYRGRPVFDRIAHVPNERDVHRSKRNAGIHIARLAEIGVKAGFFDYVLLAPFPDSGGLYLEAKRVRGSVTSEAQQSWLADYIEFGYEAVICKGADELIRAADDYLQRHAAPGDYVNRIRLTP